MSSFEWVVEPPLNWKEWVWFSSVSSHNQGLLLKCRPTQKGPTMPFTRAFHVWSKVVWLWGDCGSVPCQEQHSLLFLFALAPRHWTHWHCGVVRGLGKDGAGDSLGDKMFELTGRLATVMDSARPEQCSPVKVAGCALACLIKPPLDATVRMPSSTGLFVAAIYCLRVLAATYTSDAC